jgi:hypothetical protein
MTLPMNDVKTREQLWTIGGPAIDM